MLEKPSLLLCPWQSSPSGEAAVRVRPIMDDAGTTIGFARQSLPTTPLWLRWLKRRVLEVYEMPDNSLVFGLRRGLGWRSSWHVVDADNRLVGVIRDLAVLDGFGRFLAAIDQSSRPGKARFVAIHGRELGEFESTRKGTRVMFSPELEGNPFARMLLLGGVLAREE